MNINIFKRMIIYLNEKISDLNEDPDKAELSSPVSYKALYEEIGSNLRLELQLDELDWHSDLILDVESILEDMFSKGERQEFLFDKVSPA